VHVDDSHHAILTAAGHEVSCLIESA
jgi:hypothetical protein